MMKLAMSAPAASLLRALLGRAGVSRDRVLLANYRSTDWRSLIFEGERHEISLRLSGPDAARTADSLLGGLEDAELAIPGHILADIAVLKQQESDASIMVEIEALTIAQ